MDTRLTIFSPPRILNMTTSQPAYHPDCLLANAAIKVRNKTNTKLTSVVVSVLFFLQAPEWLDAICSD